MAVYDNFSKILFIQKKIIADPKQVPLVLLLQRHLRSHPCMGKEVIAIGE